MHLNITFPFTLVTGDVTPSYVQSSEEEDF